MTTLRCRDLSGLRRREAPGDLPRIQDTRTMSMELSKTKIGIWFRNRSFRAIAELINTREYQEIITWGTAPLQGRDVQAHCEDSHALNVRCSPDEGHVSIMRRYYPS